MKKLVLEQFLRGMINKYDKWDISENIFSSPKLPVVHMKIWLNS